MVAPAARRAAARHLVETHRVSLSRASRPLGTARSGCYYRSSRRDDSELRVALRELAMQRRRWGYRMLHVVLRRQGFGDNHKRVYRVYREERLQVPKSRKRKTARWRGERPAVATGPNQRWSMDFVSDQLADRRKLRMLTVVDDFTRQCLSWSEGYTQSC